MNTKTKTTMMIMAAALLCGIGNVCALPLRVLIEEQHAKIEPAIKKFQQECGGHTDRQACKEEHDALVKALNEFLSLVQNGFKVIDAHANEPVTLITRSKWRRSGHEHSSISIGGASSSQRCNEEGIESHCTVRRKRLRTTTEIVGFVKYWEIIADNLSARCRDIYIARIIVNGLTIILVLSF